MQRYHQLDALRGIASIQVLLGHLMLVIPLICFMNSDYTSGLELQHSPELKGKLAFYMTYTPLHFFWSGGAAVNFFFLLSGFVLASSLKGKSGGWHYIRYAVKRCFRLYLPFVIIILISMLMREICYRDMNAVGKLSEWFKDIWKHRVSVQELLGLISFTNRDFHNIVTTLWSIEIEIKVSLVIPLLLSVVHLCDKWVVLKRVWHFSIWFAAFVITHHAGRDFAHTPVFDQFVMQHILPFVTGIMLFIYSPGLIRAFERAGKGELVILSAIAVLLYINRWISWTLWGIPFFAPAFSYENDLLVVAGALFILLSFNQRVSNFLSNPYLVYAGKISYSLYLVHPVVLAAVFYSLGAVLPFSVLALAVIVISLPVSALFYKSIENPLNNLGRSLSEKLPGQKRVNVRTA